MSSELKLSFSTSTASLPPPKVNEIDYQGKKLTTFDVCEDGHTILCFAQDDAATHEQGVELLLDAADVLPRDGQDSSGNNPVHKFHLCFT